MENKTLSYYIKYGHRFICRKLANAFVQNLILKYLELEQKEKGNKVDSNFEKMPMMYCVLGDCEGFFLVCS